MKAFVETIRFRFVQKRLFPFALLMFLTFHQTLAQSPDIRTVIDSVNGATTQASAENLYLHLDKPYYAIGDTLYFKAYLFDASSLSSSRKSGILYVEIASDSGQVVKRMMIPLIAGLGWGNLTLGEKEYHEGSYTLRAYTNWMRNFAPEIGFTQSFSILDNRQQPWLVNAQTHLSTLEAKEQAQVTLRLSELNQQPLILRPLQVKLMEGQRVRYRDELQTDADGEVKLDFTLPSKSDPKAFSLLIEDRLQGAGNYHLLIPLSLVHPENVDVQFLPEGGQFVVGLAAKLGVKAVGEDGKGIGISGVIYDSHQQKVAEFGATHKGMGSVEFIPQASEIYTASVKLPNGSAKNFPLPPAKSTGSVLRFINQRESDSLEVVIRILSDNQKVNPPSSAAPFRLLAQVRGVVYYGALISSTKRTTIIKLAKKAFPSGLIHFTLLTEKRQPLNERLVYIDHEDALRIQLNPAKGTYGKRDSVALQLVVNDQQGNPIQGSFSLAVTDENRVKGDSLTETNLISRVLLTSELKGTVEEPLYYLKARRVDPVWQNLDNLLLTQGWVGYDWTPDAKKKRVFEGEMEFTVKGKVTNVLNKPVANTSVTLLSKKPFLVKDTMTDQSGQFTFKNIFPGDTAIFSIQARNKSGKSSGIGVEVSEVKPPVFAPSTERVMPWYVNSDSSKLKVIQKEISSLKEQEKQAAGNHVLKEVVVTAKKIVKGSKNLNGPGGADQILTQQDLEKAGKVTLGDLLRQRIAGLTRYNGGNAGWYKVKEKLLKICIDGMYIDNFRPMGMRTDEFYNSYLDFFTAEDISGIEVMSSTKYAMDYTRRYLDPRSDPTNYAFVEITTRAGNGPFLTKTAGTYLYRAMPFSLPKQFYRPKYAVKDAGNGIVDQRSTIHWEPNIITDKEGKATVSFYTADLPGNYRILVEGTDMNGNLGSVRQKLNIAH